LYIDWLKAMSVIELGITTATRTGFPSPPVELAPPQALVSKTASNNTSDKTVSKRGFFIFFLSPLR
jgi:hypothetical protein